MFKDFYDAITDIFQRNSGHSEILLCIANLDNFSAVNARFGEAFGDIALQTIAAELRRTAEQHNGTVYTGGDQFYLAFSGADASFDTLQLFEALFQQPFTVEGRKLHISAAIGACYTNLDTNTPDKILRNALQACIEAKKQGGDQSVIYDDESEQLHKQKLKLIQQVSEAIDKGHMTLYLQPKVTTQSRKLVGFEALLRWHHPDRGVIPPGDFLPQVAGSYADRELGCFVVEQAIAILQQQLANYPELSLSINVSPKQLCDLSFLHRVQELAKAHPELMQSLSLEILETESFENMQVIREFLHAYHACGVRLSLDDFGTGFASIGQLTILPLDEVKIDRMFVRNIHNNDIHKKVVQIAVMLAQELNLETVAEGVESADEIATLEELGVSVLQGYYYAKPFPLDQAESWIQKFNAG
ncbi:putative bifunctional diguanylate cyclase/phosphodiesterase [Pseudidiomarina taiwanensis]|uniref:Bifunctional diguanylate cyclase/phosphodiesterase n=1 Tax=Pseudidiomarina taiwanensis TaxID=337250 RepID=A0A432ZFD8_9GAMM|nr:bifunctional diguanylate cyclase/phosphodiesterase [Pseudidiomarina taiwanensis]RUO76695.1 hypothetical protein CWI83_07140 [Pseudidiomarina taiwanensis]